MRLNININLDNDAFQDGNLVEELTNNHYDSGMYMLEFSSDDIAAGTYFVRMHAKGFSVTNTMSIVK